MKTKLIMCSLSVLYALQAQAFKVDKNTVVSIGKQTQIKLTDVDLQNDGVILWDTASLLAFETSKERKISGNDMQLGSLKISGNVICNDVTLSLSGDLIMQSGVLNLQNNRMMLQGNLLGESENTYVIATSGTLEQTIPHLRYEQKINALGLEFTSLNDMYDLTLIRSHAPIVRNAPSGAVYSAKRVFEFSVPIDITEIEPKTLLHERSNISVPAVFIEDFDGWKRVQNGNDEFFSVQKISTFERDKLRFPKVITPNLASNQRFEISELEDYPNARLIILNRDGKPLYDLCPYQNDFDGKNLPNGTYYYVFSEEKNGTPTKRSFFEIVR